MSSRYQRPPQRGPVAPIHRGPQALPPGTSASPGGYYNMHAPNAALLIDFDNVTMGIQKDMQSELRNLLSSDIIKGKVSVQRAYADWRRYPGYIVPLTEASIDLIFAPAYGSAKKNATDIRLAIDAMELVFTRPEIGTFILLSGDSDFSSLVIKLKEYGKYVIGVGIRESSSDLLVQNCDEYYSYNALAGLVKTSDEETVRWDPWELVAESLGRMVKNGDVMRADRLKQVMVDIDPNFDEKDLGMSKFSRFVHEAEKRGLLTLTKQENGQFEIGVPRAAAIAAPAAPAAPGETDAERLEREEKSERSRRGRRGRGRGRDSERTPRRDEAVDGEGDADVSSETAPTVVPRPARAAVIGTGGERLTRAEAFDLVRRAVESLTRDFNDSVSMREVRVRAFELLGRDSESLGERMFERILKDAHDSDLVDLRRRGDDYELSRAAQSDSVADQLNRAAAAALAADPSPVAAAAPRGMGPRGGGGRGRAPSGRGAPPAELLSIGVVGNVSGDGAQASVAQSAPSTNAPVFELSAAPTDPVAPPPVVATPVVSTVAAAAALPPRRGRGPMGRGAPPPDLLSIGVVAPTVSDAPAIVAPVVPVVPVVPVLSVTMPIPTAPIEEPTVDAAADGDAPVRGARSRGGRGRGRGARPTSDAVIAAVAQSAPAPAPAPVVTPAAVTSAPAASAAPAARGRGRGGNTVAKSVAKTAAKTVTKTASKAAAKATPAARTAPAAKTAPVSRTAAPAARPPRAGARKTASKRGA